MDHATWDELYGHLVEDVSPFILGAPVALNGVPYVGGVKLNAQPMDAIPDVLPDKERELGSRRVEQNTDVHGKLNRDGLPAGVLKPAWEPVLDSARGLRKELDTWQDEDGRTLTPRQKLKAAETVGQTVKDIIGGKA